MVIGRGQRFPDVQAKGGTYFKKRQGSGQGPLQEESNLATPGQEGGGGGGIFVRRACFNIGLLLGVKA